MEKLKEALYAILFLTVNGFYGLIEFLWMIIRLPVRFTYCLVRGHEWLWLGNGFFGFFAPKRNFKCMKCGFKTGHPENHKTVAHQNGD